MKLIISFIAVIMALSGVGASAQEISNRANLGQMLFLDPILSKDQTQSCATCHDPEYGYADPRDNGVKGAASMGDDGKSLGDRNAPTASYAALSPAFGFKHDGTPFGGQFWDGRAATLTDQAEGPPLNGLEMAMPDKAILVTRLRDHEDYGPMFRAFYGKNIFDNADQAYRAMANAIAEYEKTPEFAPFDSKYDRYLRGDYKLTKQEDLGRILFFSQQFSNCNRCHQLKHLPGSKRETFTGYEYHNIGVPVNLDLRRHNGVALDYQDAGLPDNPQIDDLSARGKFKTPTLRNVAVTGPYMHNGVFQDLETVVLFYNKYNSRSKKAQINPETGKEWRDPEVPENLSMTELEAGNALDTKRVRALVAFMKTLTDKRYEHLLD